MKIGVHGKEFTRQSASFIEKIFEILQHYNVDVFVSSPFSQFLKHHAFKKFKYQVYEPGDNLKKLKFFISVGGDGTLLDSLTHVGKTEVPILGINTGRLGFLATISREETEAALAKVIAGDYTLDQRAALKLHSNQDIFGKLNFGLNDFTVVKKDTSSMITIHTYIDGELLNSFWADGLIVATPTGSTGYSLSCGGPIVFPHSGNLVITPVAPHNLSVRPIVVSDTSVISFEIEGRADNFLCTLDSRFEAVTAEDKLTVRKAEVVTRFIQLYDYSFLRTLHDKLTWGKDSRN